MKQLYVAVLSRQQRAAIGTMQSRAQYLFVARIDGVPSVDVANIVKIVCYEEQYFCWEVHSNSGNGAISTSLDMIEGKDPCDRPYCCSGVTVTSPANHGAGRGGALRKPGAAEQRKTGQLTHYNIPCVAAVEGLHVR